MKKITTKKAAPSTMSRQEQDLQRLAQEIVQYDGALTWMLCEITARKAKKMARQAEMQTV